MKKLISVILLLVIVLTLSGCNTFENEDIDYSCELTFYEEPYNKETISVECYSYSKVTTWVRIEKTNGDILMFDLTKISMLCTPIENVIYEEIEVGGE